MKAASLIISRPDADDKRVARYYLPDDVRSAIDSAHEELSSWTGTFGND
jgi:hypothetical protein